MRRGLRSTGPEPEPKGEGEWPELVGKTPEEAKEQILKDRPEANVQILEDHGIATADYSANRVRVFVKDGKVSATPRIG